MLFLVGQRPEVEDSAVGVLDVEFVVEELANREGTLLSVNHFVLVVADDAPVHDVEGKSLHDGVDDCLLLFEVVAEFALIGGADVEPPAIPDDSGIGVVEVSVNQVADWYGFQFDLHGLFFLIINR